MTDELGLFDEDTESGANRRGRRLKLAVFGSVIVLLIGAGAWYGWRQLSGIGGYEDFAAGPGEKDVVVRVNAGDSTGAIAATLATEGVVASSRAFVAASEDDSRVRGVQPGYYVMRTKLAGKDAVTRIVDPAARVGNLQIRPGTQFDDISRGDGAVTPGIATLLANASCAELDGQSTCVPVEQIREVATSGDLAALGAPDWAVTDASKVEGFRRMEGLVAPAVYDVKPGATAEELWKQLLADSSVLYQSWGMPNMADPTGYTPYQILTIASLVEKESIEKDFGKVSRVLYNRLATTIPLGLDSTINYYLDKPHIATSAADRNTPTPYNTYLNPGLPAGPISAPGKGALAAAVAPEAGTWTYFVLCEKDGTSCFSDTREEHEAKALDARNRGVW